MFHSSYRGHECANGTERKINPGHVHAYTESYKLLQGLRLESTASSVQAAVMVATTAELLTHRCSSLLANSLAASDYETASQQLPTRLQVLGHSQGFRYGKHITGCHAMACQH
jgi:hypothetical protein